MTEAFGRATQSLGIGLIFSRRADDQHPAIPAARREKLAERIGEHAAARQGMQDIRQATLAAQCIVGTAGVDQQRFRHGVRQLAQGLGRRVDHEQAQAVGVLLAGLFQEFFRRFAGGRFEHIAVLEKTPRAVAVGDRQLGAAQAGVFRLGNDVGEHRAGVWAITEITDAYRQLLAGCRCSELRAAGEGDQETGSS